MNVDTGAFQALTERVEQLAERVEQLHRQAILIKSLEQISLEMAGYPVSQPGRTGRPRHLRPVDGGAS